MTTNNAIVKQDLKKIGTLISNKWKVFLTRHNDDILARAILKVTSSKNKCPNEKHMERLLLYTYELGALLMDYRRSSKNHRYRDDQINHYETNVRIINSLEKRLHAHQWTVVLKTLIVLHRLMKDGSSSFQRILCSQNGLFCVARMKDLSDDNYGRSMQRFIRKYAIALEERSKMTRDVSAWAGALCNIDEFFIWKSLIKDSIKEQRKIFVSLLNYLEAILRVQVYSTTVDNPVVALSWMFLAQDVRRLVHLLSEAAIRNMEEKLKCSTAPGDLLDIIERYNKALESVQELFRSLHQCSRVFECPGKLQTIPLEKIRNIWKEEARLL